MNYGIVVDGYSSGAALIKEFNSLGVHCLHVQSTSQAPEVYLKSFNKNAYVKNFMFDNNLQELLEIFKLYNPIFVITGSELGVELADLIAAKLNIPTRNPLKTSINRRNKFYMQEQLKTNGLAFIRQFKSSSCYEILEWIHNLGKWPVVIKPLRSSGGDRVSICYSVEDVIAGFNEIVTTVPNILGIVDEEALVQEYIEAPEVAVNSVQFEGKSYLGEVVQFHKLTVGNNKKIYDYANVLTPDNYDPALIDYAFTVASVLDIKYGPMHAEIFITDEGPVLIEAAARLMGANVPLPLMKQCLTHSQPCMTALAYARPKDFLVKVQSLPEIKKKMRIVFLISNAEGELFRVNYLDEIHHLPSFYETKLRVDDKVSLTTDYDSSPGLIYLCHEDEEVIEKDYLQIRYFEKNNMYQLRW